MLSRITNQAMATAAQRNLQAGQSRLAMLQEKAGTLQNIARPSDDPSGLATAAATRAQLRAADQYNNNISDGTGWLNTADAALGQAANIMNRVRDLTLQASNGTLPGAAKEAIAIELDSLNKDLLSAANTKYLGRNVFAGSSDSATAFSGNPPVFNGVPGSSVERRVDADQTVRVDADGGMAFGNGAESVFALVSNIATALRSGGGDPALQLSALNTRLHTVTSARTDVGTRQAQLEAAKDGLSARKATLEAQRSALEDADIGQVVLDLKLHETNYQVALAVTARVLQPTLMDFLR